MPATSKPRKPSFFWQAVLILLPVMILVAVSLASFRRDEAAAERDARQRAAEGVQSLARVLRYTVNDELHRFLTLQKMWMLNLRLNSQPSVTRSPDKKLAADIARWEQDYPGLKLAALATGDASLLEDGRQLDPPDVPIAPEPPKWFRDLTAAQKQLWENLPKTFDASAPREPEFAAFENSGASPEAIHAARNLEERLKYHAFNYGVFVSDPDLSETGVSFQSIALEQMLAGRGVTPPIARLNADGSLDTTNDWPSALWNEVVYTPSFVAPSLLDLAEKRTNELGVVMGQKIAFMRQLWDIQNKEREWVAPLRHVPELKEKWNPPAFWTRWTDGPAGEALAFGEPVTFTRMGADLAGVPFSGRGQGIEFIPREVIEAIFNNALFKNSFLIPGFAEASVSVDGKSLRPASVRSPADGQSLLGTGAGLIGDSSRPDAAGFEIKFFLTNRSQMLAAERRRAKLFGALVIGAAFTALIGLFATRRAFQRQEQLNDLKSNFVSSVSHELRAPIASVRLMAENLERGKIPDPARQGEYFHFIVQECRRLSSLIENVLDFSRIEQGRKQYDFEPTNLAALTETTVKLMEPYAAEKGVNLKLETSSSAAENGNLEMNIDGRAIQQALVNLIDNAVKHSPKGEKVTIEIKRAADPINHQLSTINLSVTDHGPGIPVAEREKIFERFYRLGSELRRETQGVGIGLSVVKHIVEAHSGRVIVKSEVGKGSRFTIELPVKNRTE
ncbi:MAG TPA: ATP-binding protein [Verrucomicrobiae bacterium]|nr:ATP-binding protein [Verrucomicrobiae bacterium]